MALRDIQIARQEVPVAGTSFLVRGLSFADLSRLVIDHRVSMLAAIERIQKADKEDIAALAEGIALAAPELVAATISLAADAADDTERAIVAELPLPVQLDAVLRVAQLTFTEPGAFPKFLAQVAGLLRSGKDLVAQQRLTGS